MKKPSATHRDVTHLNAIILFGVLLVAAVAMAAPVYSSRSKSSPAASSHTNVPTALSQVSSLNALNSTTRSSLSAVFPMLVPVAPPAGLTITTYDATDCSTPKVSFNLGETVCAIITGTAQPANGRASTRIGWVSPYGALAQGTDITTDPQTVMYVIPATATQTFTDVGGGTVTVDNRGVWRLGVFSALDGSLIGSTNFTVHDPVKAYVDLSVHQSTTVGESEVGSGSGSVFKLFVSNSGPDTAQSVVLSDTVPANTTFTSAIEDTNLGFTCGTPVAGVFTCTVDSLPAGAAAQITFAYGVVSGTPAGTVITNVATVSSSATPCAPDATCDLVPDDNSSSFTSVVPADTGSPSCTLQCPDNITVTANTTQASQLGAFVNYSSATPIGSCGAVINTPGSGSFFNVGTHIVTSNSDTGDSCTFTVTVTDTNTPAPTISCPVDQVGTADGTGFATVTVGTPTAGPTGVTVNGLRSDSTPAVIDESGNVVTPAVIVPLTDPYPTGVTIITWTASDSFGRTASCNQKVTVLAACSNDTTPPTITIPPDINVGTGPGSTTCGVVIDPGVPVATDDCSAAVTTAGIPAGNLFPIGTTTIVYTAIDGAGHSATATQHVTVTDNTPPVIFAPANASYTCASQVPAADPSQAFGPNIIVIDPMTEQPVLQPGPVFDNCGSPTVTVSDTSTGAGSAASPKVITRTYTATDTHGNSASAVQIITVTDPTPPTITAPANASYQCASNVPAANASQASASDNCGSVTVAVSQTTNGGAGSTASPLVLTRTYTATDAAGNSTSAAQTITVIDNTPPTITAPANAGYQCPSQVPAASPSQATASDNCVAPTVTVSQTTNGGIGSAASPLVITRTFTATDAANNSASAVQTITVIDNTPPVITCVADIVADFNPVVNGAVVTYTAPVGSDNCSGATTTQIAGLASGATFPLGTTTNTFRVTDAAGLTASCSFKVTVALTSLIGLDSVSITGSGYADSYSSAGGYPATKGSLANILSNGTITIGGSGKVWGNVRSTRTNIAMSGSAQVTGNATAGTTVTKSGSATVLGTTTNNALAPVMTLPSVPACSPFSSNSGISGTYTYNAGTGDLSLSGVNIATLANGNYCFHNVTLGNSTQLKVNGPVVIKMTGTLNTSGSSNLNNTTQIPSNLQILSSYSGSNGVVIGNSASIYALIYAPQTGLNLSGSAPLFGTADAKTLTIGNSGAIHYDTQLKSVWPAVWTLIFGP